MRQKEWFTGYGLRRRQMIKHAALVAGAGAVAGCTGGGGGETTTTTTAGDGDETTTDDGMEQMTLSLAGPPLSLPQEDPVAKTFSETYNVDTSVEPTSATPSDMISLFSGGGGQDKFDAVLDNGGGMEDLLGREDIVTGIDTGKIPNWDNAIPIMADSDGEQADTIRYDGEVHMVPTIRNADTLIYNKDAIDGIESWGALFDEQYAGQTAIVDDYARTPANTALYLKENDMVDIEDTSNMEPGELEQVIDFLIEKKQAGQFKTIWKSFQNVVSLHQNGEVVVSDGYEPVAVALRAQGVEVGYPPLKEGPHMFMNGWMMTNGCVNRGRQDAYYRLAEYCMTPEYGARMIQDWSFLPSIKPELVEQELEENPDQYDTDLVQQRIDAKLERYNTGSGSTWNNVYPDHFDTYVSEWNRFLNA